MTRERLPLRRQAETFEFEHVNPSGKATAYVATLGFFDDGRLGEIFISSPKVGTDADIAVRDAAILASFALQHGVTVETVRSAMTRDARGRPEGVLGTLLDLLAKEGTR